MENRSDCKSTITTFLPLRAGTPAAPNTSVAAQGSTSPVAVRVAPKVKVTVVVHKRPLESVQSQLTCNQVPKPDVLGTVIGQLAKPLGGLTVWAALAAPTPPPVITPSDVNFIPPPPAHFDDAVRRQFREMLNSIGADQETAMTRINSQNDVLTDVTREFGAAQRYPPVLTDSGWSSNDIATFRRCVKRLIVRASGQDPSPFPVDSCEALGSDQARASRASKQEALPSANVTSLNNRLTPLALPKALDDLDTTLKTKGLHTLTQPERSEFADAINALADRQDSLTAALKAAQTTRATLSGYGQTLDTWNKAWPGDSDLLVTQSFTIFCDAAKSGQATGSAKLSTQTLLTKEAGDGGAVAVTWVHQPWEVSAGIMLSTVLGRSFQNSPVINGGVPVLDPSGKQLNEVTMSTTKPTIDALILVHWRFYEKPAFTNRRFAILGSVGVGTGTNGSGADFALGPSFALGNFFLSPLLHFTRDLRLTNGVTLGQNLSGTSPPTERYWVHKFGLAFTYAVPIT